MSDRGSYSQILRSSAIIGGAHGLNYAVGLLRVKLVAVLLGPAGVGLIGLYQSVTSVIGTVSGMGIGASGVREVAKTYGQGDGADAARTMLIVNRMAWLTGLLGWALTAALAYPASLWILGDTAHAVPLAILGSTLLLGSIAGAKAAILQGARRIGDIARVNVYAMLVNTALAIALYAWLRQQGIVPVLVVTAFVSLGVAYWFARRVEVPAAPLGWPATFTGARGLLGLGSAFMWSGLLTAGLDMFTRALITRQFGIDVAGQYQAAWALSGMFAGFIVGAMGADFYPRLTSVIADHERASRVVNEQTEIGILLALPGLVATLSFAPLVVYALYTKEFLPAAELLPWLVLGVFGRVVSWPLGYIILAAGASRWFAISETVFIALQLGLVLWLVPIFGPLGAAFSLALNYVAYTICMLWMGHSLIGFKWSAGVIRLIALSALIIAVAAGATFILQPAARYLLGAALCIIAGVTSAKGLARRLGNDHRLVIALNRIPGASTILGA